jgi:hypothetical protein
MKIEFVKLPWFKGTPVYWNLVRLGYTSYRFFCLGIRVYK